MAKLCAEVARPPGGGVNSLARIKGEECNFRSAQPRCATTIAMVDVPVLKPSVLREHYSDFLDARGAEKRILLTGHSHQAWPSVAREGFLEAYASAAQDVDGKWGAAMEAADAVRGAAAAALGGKAEQYALAPNTHELGARFLSALNLSERPRVVTTAGEFHSLRRQLDRIAEEGIEVVRVPVAPLETLGERLRLALDERTAALMVSTVLFETSSLVPNLAAAIEGAEAVGAEVLLDAYHHFAVAPWKALSPKAFVVAGGYKYAQWGEGCCFLRVPEHCALRPIYTGWFSDFSGLEGPQGKLRYGNTPADRFAGSTYDPTSHFRARRVIRFFEEQGLSVAARRALSLHQTGLLMKLLEPHVPILTPREPELRAGFVAVEVENAASIAAALKERGVWVDARGKALRFGPAPYILDEELEEAVAQFVEVMR